MLTLQAQALAHHLSLPIPPPSTLHIFTNHTSIHIADKSTDPDEDHIILDIDLSEDDRIRLRITARGTSPILVERSTWNGWEPLLEDEE